MTERVILSGASFILGGHIRLEFFCARLNLQRNCMMAATSSSRGSSRQTGGTNRASSKSRPSDGRSKNSGAVGQSQPQQVHQHQNFKEVVGNYMLQKKLGVGTFGEVRLAIHIPTGMTREHYRVPFELSHIFVTIRNCNYGISTSVYSRYCLISL